MFDDDHLHELMALIPNGHWISYGELAAEAGTSGRGLGSHVKTCTKCPNAWRVLDEQGRPSESFRWSDPREARSPREILESEGIEFEDDRAHPTRRIGIETLLTSVGHESVEWPTIEWVKVPVDLATGKPNGSPIAMRHLRDCDHWFLEPEGGWVGEPPFLASDVQMTALAACKDCSYRAGRAGHPPRGQRLGQPAPRRSFWWVSQGYNYDVAIEQQTLWSLPNKLRDLPHRRLLLEMRPGDVVLHYASRFLRAVSVVKTSWRPATRPPGYLIREGDGDDGWLVELEVKHKDLELPFHDIARLIPHGPPGPLNRFGVPMQIYVARLSEDSAAALATAAGADITAPIQEDPMPLRPALMETDSAAMTQLRREQGYLRRHLLQNSDEAPCALCGRVLPAHLLVAAHIVPRRMLDDAERLNFTAAAFLACTLGCDSLFEYGYIAVNGDGLIMASRSTDNEVLRATVEALAGRQVLNLSKYNAASFARHRELHSESTVETTRCTAAATGALAPS